MPEATILMYCGYDVVMVLKTLRLGFWTLAYFSPYALGVILPLNCITGGAKTGYFTTTLSNVYLDDKTFLWVHLFGVVLFQCIAMLLTLNVHLEVRIEAEK